MDDVDKIQGLLNNTRKKLSDWNNNVYGNIGKRIKQIQDDIAKAVSSGEDRPVIKNMEANLDKI